jgi:putative transposase
MRSQTYPVRQVCRVLGDTRRHDYDRPRAGDDAILHAAIVRLAAAWPTSGYRRITAVRPREGWQVNRKHVARLIREMGLQGHAPARPVRTTPSAHPYPRDRHRVQGLMIVRPAQVWVGDITYVRLRDECVYLAVLMDGYTRRIRGWHLSRQLDQALTLTAWRRALAQHRPEIHHADQGGQYAATAYMETWRGVGAHISMATVGEPTENGAAERLMRTIKAEEVTLHAYADFHDAYQHLRHFLDDVYPHKRMHAVLGYLTPAAFETPWQQQQTAAAAGTLARP